MSTGPSNLYDMADAILVALQAELLAEGADPFGTAYVNGKGTLPVATCASLVVGWTRTRFGSPGGADQTGPRRLQMRSRSADLSVWAMRCISTFGDNAGYNADFNAADEAADALPIMTDAYLLPRCLNAVIQAGVIRDYGTQASFGPVIPMEPEGAIGGCMMDFSIDLA